jgi:hypothetical protein
MLQGRNIWWWSAETPLLEAPRSNLFVHHTAGQDQTAPRRPSGRCRSRRPDVYYGDCFGGLGQENPRSVLTPGIRCVRGRKWLVRPTYEISASSVCLTESNAAWQTMELWRRRIDVRCWRVVGEPNGAIQGYPVSLERRRNWGRPPASEGSSAGTYKMASSIFSWMISSME